MMQKGVKIQGIESAKKGIDKAFTHMETRFGAWIGHRVIERVVVLFRQMLAIMCGIGTPHACKERLRAGKLPPPPSWVLYFFLDADYFFLEVIFFLS